jgi:glycosyltransferase involved in cell wall biosynthesis
LTAHKPRLTFITNNIYLVGGGERLALEMVTRLRKDFEITMLNPVSSKENVVKSNESFVKTYNLQGIKVVDLDTFGIKVNFLATEPYVLRIFKPSSLAKYIHVIRNSDVVYQMSLNPVSLLNFVLFGRLFRKKIVLGVHNFSVARVLESKEGLKNRIVRRLVIALFSNVHYFHVTNSRDTRLIEGLFPGAEVRRIPNFITRKKEKAKSNSREFRCLYVGRLETSGKGTDLLCKAIELVLAKNKKIKFWIIGKGATGETLVAELVKKYPNNVKWLGFVSEKELGSAYDSASLLTHPSRGEAFSLVVLEAQSHGLPAVTFDIDGPRDLLKHEFQGSTVRKFDVEEFAEKIEQNYALWTRDKEGYRRRKQRIIDYVYKRYGADSIIRQLKDFFLSD